jgi:Flp pilus assembly CpaE family ATPase
VAQVEAVLTNLASLCNVVVLDLGDGLRPYVKPALKTADRVIIVTEPLFPSTVLAKELVEDLEASGIGRHKIHLALVTRERTSLQQPWRQVASELGLELAGILSPAPEQAHQAAQGGRPLIVVHPESLVSDQIHKLAEHIATNLHLVPA